LNGRPAYGLCSFDVDQGPGERTVVWRGKNGAIILRHISKSPVRNLPSATSADAFSPVPEGAVPFTFHSNHNRDHPEDQNAVTFVDEDGRNNHRFLFGQAEAAPEQYRYPCYRFPNDKPLCEFQQKVFDKKLLHTFDVEKISRQSTTNRLLARRQQLKIWRKNQVPYVTFFVHLATGHRNQHHEFDIRWFNATAQLEDSKTVVLTFYRGSECRKTSSHSEHGGKRKGSVMTWVRQLLSCGYASADEIQDPTPELIPYEKSSFPRSVTLHTKVPEPPSDHHRHLLNWVSLKIEFTNDGG
jgi:hypothetical protein